MSHSLASPGGSCTAKSRPLSVPKTDQARADRILCNVQKERGGVQAIAACIDRAPGSVQRWVHVPAIHVGPLLKAHDCGWLTRRMVTIALGVSNADKRKAGNLLAIIRATPGGMAVLAQAAGRSLDATRKWKTVPDALCRWCCVSSATGRVSAGLSALPARNPPAPASGTAIA